VEGEAAPAVGETSGRLRVALGLHRFARKEGGDAKGTAGAPLAVQAMADRNPLRLTRAGEAQLSAGAGGGPRGHDFSSDMP
jgi:hypothetical protein